MKAGHAIKDIAKLQGMSINRLSSIVGARQQTLNRQVNQHTDMRVETLTRLANVLNYDLVLVPKGSKLPMNSYVIDDSSQSFSAI